MLKKAMELSVMCNQQIYLVIYDKDYQRMVQFMSDEDFDVDEVKTTLSNLSKMKKKLSLRTFTNADFQDNLISRVDDDSEICLDSDSQPPEMSVALKAKPKKKQKRRRNSREANDSGDFETAAKKEISSRMQSQGD